MSGWVTVLSDVKGIVNVGLSDNAHIQTGPRHLRSLGLFRFNDWELSFLQWAQSSLEDFWGVFLEFSKFDSFFLVLEEGCCCPKHSHCSFCWRLRIERLSGTSLCCLITNALFIKLFLFICFLWFLMTRQI